VRQITDASYDGLEPQKRRTASTINDVASAVDQPKIPEPYERKQNHTCKQSPQQQSFNGITIAGKASTEMPARSALLNAASTQRKNKRRLLFKLVPLAYVGATAWITFVIRNADKQQK
jgi:hypothetical protein